VSLSLLYDRGYRKVVAEEGGGLLGLYLKIVWLTSFGLRYPYIFVGRDAVSLVEGEEFSSVEGAVKLEPYHVSLCECKKEIHVRYKVEKFY
jgi:riboflavin biosynthesis pyrimidine reductase